LGQSGWQGWPTSPGSGSTPPPEDGSGSKGPAWPGLAVARSLGDLTLCGPRAPAPAGRSP
jgi:hypothetical protein